MDDTIYSMPSTESVFDGVLSKKVATQRITDWLEMSLATNYVFYFCGDGSKNGLGLHRDILQYKYLAHLIHSATFTEPDGLDQKDPEDAELIDKYRNPNITVIIDAVHSVGIEEAFKPFSDRGDIRIPVLVDEFGILWVLLIESL